MSVQFSFSFKRTSPVSSLSKKHSKGLFFEGAGGATAILIHGLTGTPHEMRYVAGFLHKKGYSASCPRLANHGEPLSVLKKTKWQDCYASVRDEFLRVRKKRAGDVIFAAGLSMGALLALLLAEEFPDDVAAVSCLSPTLFYDGWNTPWARHLLPIAYFTPIKHIAYFKEDPPYGIKNEAIRQRVHKYYENASIDDVTGADQFGYPYFPMTLLCELRRLVIHLTARLSAVKVPVQIIQAHEDDMTSVKNARFIYERVSSASKEIVLLDNSYHIVTADQERAKVSRKMHEFFERAMEQSSRADLLHALGPAL